MAKAKEDTMEVKSKMELFLEKKQTPILYFAMFLFLALSLLSFDPKMSTGGDDASYIVRAFRLINEGRFPTFQGPLYPIFLVPFVAAFGLHINLLKTLSILLGLGSLYIFHKSFKDRISYVVLTYALLFQAFNYQLIYYASQTYNEQFYLFVQGLFVFVFFKYLDVYNTGIQNIRETYKQWILLGFMVLLVVLAKNIGLAAVIAMVGFFFLQKRYVASALSAVSFAVVYFPYRFLRDFIWDTESPFTRQGAVFLYKDPYNYSKGKEEFSGFVTRFYENIHIYLSKNFPKIVGLRDQGVMDKVELLGYIIVFFIIFAFIRSWLKKNREIFFISIFVLVSLGVTFVILQTRWDSDRLIIFMTPYLILLCLYSVFELFDSPKRKYLSVVVHLGLVLLLFQNLQTSFKNVDLLTTKKNLSGDRYHGYSPDWVNYIKMSEWIADNLPEEDLVGVRKQTMSIIFSGGRQFYSISRVPSENPDTLLNNLKEAGVKYVVMASLRRNPKVKTKYTINTVKRYLYYIEQKYPGTCVPVKEIGTSEPATLFMINYPR